MTTTTVVNGKTWYQTESGYLFPTEAEATNWDNALIAYTAVMATVPDQLSDEAYRQVCNENGLAVMDMVKSAYGIKYAEITPKHGATMMIQYAVALRRLNTIESEPKAAPATRPDDYPAGRKLDCGCTVYSQNEVMTASFGSSCSECYDRMSN